MCSKNTINSYRDDISKAGMCNRFLIYEGSISFVRLLELADISVRATNTDGDAISVRESLFMNCRTIASDASSRPAGVILFANRNPDDLTEKLMYEYMKCSKTSNVRSTLDCTTHISQIYRKFTE